VRALGSILVASAAIAIAAAGCVVQPAGDAEAYDVGADTPGRAAPAGTTVVSTGGSSDAVLSGSVSSGSIGVGPSPATAGPTPDPWHIGADPGAAGPTPDPWDPGRARSTGSTAGPGPKDPWASSSGSKQSK
jgi:hypothetical protein